ncbi:MAG: type II toxin-antitoxin system VapC family toxin [Solirubrobacterales bacterium]
MGLSCALDAWAVLAVLRDEAAAPRVREGVLDGAVSSWINLGEALYQQARRQSFDSARDDLSRFAATITAEEPNRQLIESASALKAAGGISYADCFAVATAERHGVPLLTGDPEILALERPELTLVDLRGA